MRRGSSTVSASPISTSWSRWRPGRRRPVAPLLRPLFHGPFILNGGYDRETGNAALAAGEADLISFGVLFLANPDLPERFAAGAPLNPPDRATFYQGGEKGYIDYPTHEVVGAGDLRKKLVTL